MSLTTNLPNAEVNYAQTVQAGKQPNNTPRTIMSRAGALLCNVPIKLSLRHNRVRVDQSPKSVTSQDDLSHALSQLTAEALSGHENGYPSRITEMSGWWAGRDNADDSEDRQRSTTAATAESTHASNNNNVTQESARPSLVKCPPRQHDKGTNDHVMPPALSSTPRVSDWQR